ncbi:MULTISPECIES: glycosyltransferase [unclassified Arthrobacter]|uniref:glycosyltransferase family 2 protein n=1 Tax=unclassified Arthrobacter TaxID=235627 RepID=UPI0021064760|nr:MULTISPECIES: glycosyltransferase [unclassified Arthrobacter]MCQ1945376.1 glycosyltransferase [Arthrobacter sp. zg-Y1116]MCQ1994963.1 glycosyltransferase [Arthrobacter sp. zg-Y1171]UWX80979.1 glycosyltransferase [Arthrobacter sp. zg-Y1171]
MAAVDILLPYYGDEDLMRQSVRSVQDQDSPDWRLLVLDDAYPGGDPRGWFTSLQDPRIHYERNEENLGANRNFQKALGLAEAPVVVMMGADDVMLPGYLDAVLGLLDAYPGAAVVQPGVSVIDGDGLAVSTLVDRIKSVLTPGSGGTVSLAGEEMAASLLHAGWHYFPSLAWRREVIQGFGFRPEYDVVQDLALLMDIAASGGSIVVSTGDVVFHYRRHDASDSSVRAMDGRRFDEERRFFQDQALRFTGLGWNRAARAARLHWTSRLHAVSLLMRSLPRPTSTGIQVLGRHALT